MKPITVKTNVKKAKTGDRFLESDVERCKICGALAIVGYRYRDCSEPAYLAQEIECKKCDKKYKIHLEGPCLFPTDFCEGNIHCQV
jgi:hypothetical protein